MEIVKISNNLFLLRISFAYIFSLVLRNASNQALLIIHLHQSYPKTFQTNLKILNPYFQESNDLITFYGYVVSDCSLYRLA